MPDPGAPTRPSIQKLPPLLVNQIAAGEVVERPASVVKEIVENALDAGATAVRLELEQGGIELVRITDNGCGIGAEQLPLAVAPHATSKIRVAEDLDRIATMGFRGEALASIASVSRLTIRSRTPDDTAASEVHAEGDRIDPVRPASGPVGTCVTVRNLFFNTPARRKFLRTQSTEQGHCLDAFTTLALAHPMVAFTAACDGRTVLDLAPDQSPRERALDVLGRELAEQLLEVGADHFDDARGVALWGMIGLPSIARATAKAQHVFLNGRPIRDKTVQHAIREAYRGLIEPGRYPTTVLMLEMSPAAVDVNVHPAKTEVRFRDQSTVHGVVLRALRDALRAADLTPVAFYAPGAPRANHLGPGSSVGLAPLAPPVTTRDFVDYFKRAVPASASETVGGRLTSSPVSSAPETAAAAEPPVPEGPAAPNPEPALLDARPADRVLQIHNSYVVTQDDQGILIVDQHALHERVMFEALLARVTGETEAGTPLESQRLLLPATLQATPAQVARLDGLRDLLSRIGIAAEPIGPTSVAVHAFPTFLFDRGVEPAEFLTELLERAEADGFVPGSEEALHEVLDMMACKAAVKAGDRMSEHELRDLLRFREAVERSSNCPHGRPTSIRLTIRELEKRFGRT